MLEKDERWKSPGILMRVKPGAALCLCKKGAGILILYDLVTVQNQYQEHDAVEVLEVILA
jgi:hypothetical protein